MKEDTSALIGKSQLCVNGECEHISDEKDCERSHDESEDDELKYFEIVLPAPYERYQINFLAMQQTNRETYYMRAIRYRKCVQRTE